MYVPKKLAAADLPPGFARLPEPLRGVRQIRHNFSLQSIDWWLRYAWIAALSAIHRGATAERGSNTIHREI